MEKEKKVLGYLPRKGKESQVWHSGASVLGGGSVGERAEDKEGEREQQQQQGVEKKFRKRRINTYTIAQI